MSVERWIQMGFVAVGALHLLPSAVTLLPSRLAAAYGIDIDGPDLALLLRHRAVLLGLVGAALVAAAFVPPLRIAALVAGAVSVTTFLVLHMTTPGTNAATMRVAQLDVGALIVLLLLATSLVRHSTPATPS